MTFTAKDMPVLDPSPWCMSLPTQPRFWDNSWLQTGMHCWRHFWLSAVRGLRSGPPAGGIQVPGAIERPDLIFGSLIHNGADIWAKARAAGADPEDATLLAAQYVLEQSWPKGQERDVFGGQYAWVWQCKDRTKTNSKKGIVRCEWSKAEHLERREPIEGERPMCSGCHGDVDRRIAYVADEKVKGRRGLLRAMVSLCDHLNASGAKPMLLEDGRVGSEVRWFQPLSIASPDGEPYMMTGSFDQIAKELRPVIRELKTTRREPNAKYFAGLEGSPQVYTYTWAARGQVGEHTQVLLTVLHLGVGFCEVYSKPVRHSPTALDEWQQDMEHYIKEAELRAQLARGYEQNGQDPAQAYPRRFSACASLPGAPTTPCPFAGYCHMAPEDREAFLLSNFHVDPFNPLGTKGVTTEALGADADE